MCIVFCIINKNPGNQSISGIFGTPEGNRTPSLALRSTLHQFSDGSLVHTDFPGIPAISVDSGGLPVKCCYSFLGGLITNSGVCMQKCWRVKYQMNPNR